MIRPYLRDLKNNHKPAEKLSNNVNNINTERGEWKIQIIMQSNCISTRNFEDTSTIYSASKPVEIFSDTNEAIDKLFNILLQRFQQAIKTSIEKWGSEFNHESVALLYYYFQKLDIKSAESYIVSPDWIAHKGATINPIG